MTTKEKKREILIENIYQASKKYKYRNDFREQDSRLYKRAQEFKMLDVVCSHMVRKPYNRKKNLKTVLNIKYTKKDFLNYAKQCENREVMKIAYPTLYNLSMNNGWLDEFYGEAHHQNFWTFEKCLKIAKQCENSKEFYINHNNVYQTACVMGWLKDITKQINKSTTKNKKPNGYWNNYNNCKRAAKQCKTFQEFQLRFNTSYVKSKEYGWFEEITSHIEPQRFPKNYYDKETCIQILKNYSNIKELVIDNKKFYNYLHLMGWYKKLTKELKFNNVYWTKNKCIDASKEHPTRTKLYDNVRGAYMASRKNGWLDDIYPKINS